MTEAQRHALEEKKQQIALQLKAKEVADRFIVRHWLDYYEAMLQLGIRPEVVFFLSAAPEELPYYQKAIKALGHPLLSPEMVTTGGSSPMDEFFDAFPSTSHFKYVIDLPVISTYGGDPSNLIKEACKQLGIENGPVYFMSNDTLPVLQLPLSDLAKHATTLFDDGGLVTLIFTDPDKKWVIFRSIEEEWRCGYWPEREQ